MTKAKATKLDKEIQEGLYDPKAVTRQITAKEWNTKKKHGYTLIKNGQKYILRLDKGKTVLEPVKVFDPKKPATIYTITDSKGNKKKVAYAKWLKWMKEQKRPYDPKSKIALVKGLSFTAYLRYKRAFEKSLAIQGTKLKPLSFEGWKKTEKRIHKQKLYDPKSLPSTHWYEAMVKGIKKSSDVRNPYAIVKSIWSKLSPAKRSEIRAREKKGERFKYDLPLPVDKPTRGTGTVRMVKPFRLAEVQVNLSVKDYLAARASGLFQKMKRDDGTTALVARCKSPQKNVNVFVDKAGK